MKKNEFHQNLSKFKNGCPDCNVRNHLLITIIFYSNKSVLEFTEAAINKCSRKCVF